MVNHYLSISLQDSCVGLLTVLEPLQRMLALLRFSSPEILYANRCELVPIKSEVSVGVVLTLHHPR